MSTLPHAVNTRNIRRSMQYPEMINDMPDEKDSGVQGEKLPEQSQQKPDKTMGTEFTPFHSTQHSKHHTSCQKPDTNTVHIKIIRKINNVRDKLLQRNQEKDLKCNQLHQDKPLSIQS